MKRIAVPFFLPVLIVLLTASCMKQSLTGHWKLQRVDLFGTSFTKKLTFDLNQPEKLREVMVRSFLQDPREERFQIDDSAEINADVEKTIDSWNKVSLDLFDNGKFAMISNGVIVPLAIPGWSFGESLEGKWSKLNDTLTLSNGSDKHSYEWKFKILQATEKNLNLKEISESVGLTGNELWLRKR